jgi:hypothetical protein
MGHSFPSFRNLSLLASAAILVGAAVYAQTSGNPHGPKMANVPGLVTASLGSTKLTGHFEIRPALPGEPGIFSTVDMGGACLVAQYPAKPQACNKHTQCGLPSSGVGEGAASYCLPESPGAPTADNSGVAPPVGAGSCWIKPSEDFCLKRQGVGSHEITQDSAPVAAATGVKKWRVLTCLNGIPAACTGQVSATPNEYQHQAGPVFTAP